MAKIIGDTYGAIEDLSAPHAPSDGFVPTKLGIAMGSAFIPENALNFKFDTNAVAPNNGNGAGKSRQ